MTNKVIAQIFVGISWFMLAGSVLLAAPLFIFYSLACIAMAHIVYHDQRKKR